MQKPAKVAKKLQIFYFSFDNKNMSNELNVFVNKFIAVFLRPVWFERIEVLLGKVGNISAFEG